MLRFINLGSGSRGNASYLQCGEVGLLIDCGFSRRELFRRLAAVGIKRWQIGAILLTHEHTDHCQGIRLCAADLGVPVMLTVGTARINGLDKKVSCRFIHPGIGFQVGGFEVFPLPVSHDAVEPCAYRIRAAGQTVALLTDLGTTACLPESELRLLDHLYVEANYDEDLLRHSSYPDYLQKRIAGDRGHLSNEQCGILVARLAAVSPRLQTVTLAHLSEKNNKADRALTTVRGLAAANFRVRWSVASQDQPTVIVS